MAKQSARFVILSGLLKGLTTEQIVAEAKDKALVTKEDKAIQRDINWYKSHAKKEGLMDAEGNTTAAGEDFLKNAGKKPKAEKPAETKKPEETKTPAKKPAAKKPAAKKPVAKKPATETAKQDEEL